MLLNPTKVLRLSDVLLMGSGQSSPLRILAEEAMGPQSLFQGAEGNPQGGRGGVGEGEEEKASKGSLAPLSALAPTQGTEWASRGPWGLSKSRSSDP